MLTQCSPALAICFAAIGTESKIMVCTWLGELNHCSYLPVMPGPAWVLLSYVLSSVRACMEKEVVFMTHPMKSPGSGLLATRQIPTPRSNPPSAQTPLPPPRLRESLKYTCASTPPQPYPAFMPRRQKGEAFPHEIYRRSAHRIKHICRKISTEMMMSVEIFATLQSHWSFLKLSWGNANL